MSRAVVLGASGVSGRAIAAELASAGWEVVGTGRRADRFPAALAGRRVRFVQADRYELRDLRRVLAPGADVVVDRLCYAAEHARQLLAWRGSFGSATVLSSKAVYVDDQGRHANSSESPRFAGPVGEEQPVLEPDFSGAYRSPTGYGANKVAAEITLRESGAPISILRPSRIHGPGATPPREWFVVRRLLDGRTRIPVAHRGLAANHPTAAENLARLVATCARQPGGRVLNAADPDRPTAADVVRAIARAARRDVEVVGLDHDAPAELGWTPWSTYPPFLLNTDAAGALGYTPAGTYAETIAATVEELLRLARRERATLEQDEHFVGRFDYRLDDAALARHRAR